MKRSMRLLFACALFCAITMHASQVRADTLYATNRVLNLFGTVDTATGAFTTIGSTVDSSGGLYGITGIAFDPISGVLFGSSRSGFNGLVTIDINSGLVTRVGPYGHAVPDVAFNSSGVLYGSGRSGLSTINTTTGAQTYVGVPYFGGQGHGLAISAGGTMFVAATNLLITLDPTTGLPLSSTTLTSSGPFGALAFDSTGTLFAISPRTGPNLSASTLSIIDPTTGAVTVIGSDARGIDGIAFQPTNVPEPSGLALLGAGLALLVLRKRA
jgi:hypothetical protein